ncbi:hypothetical protein FGG08_001391 [Glutinoglossum americanum]|uniref:Cellular morphogenesis protein n=1 Tax=Glutinoglossum americanum TaxID=1670608 RepID=A0A9P8IGY2_9PEZI|nr:hypothetical protein FGG08_001391 [Glutinoglossum americanum]
MRFRSLLAPTAAGFSSFAQLWSLIASFVSTSHAIDLTPVPAPNLDLGNLGRVGLVGDFDAISLFTYAQQNEHGFSTNGSQSIIAQIPGGGFVTLASTDASISAMCPLVLKNGTFAGVIVAGNFTSLGGLETQGIALFDPDTAEVTPLRGLQGKVVGLLCDKDSETVFVGGDFKGANSTNAIAWVVDSGWMNLPFAGFNGPVNSIAKAANGNVVFGGSFDGFGNTTTPGKKDEQVINIPSGTISAGSTTISSGFSDPRNIVCKASGQDGAGNTWLLSDNQPGYWRAEFKFGFIPTKLRVWNTHLDGRGTKTFRFTAMPINGIMNFTFTDPETNQNATCDARCPLSSKPDVAFQDFHFVNPIGMSAFQIDISDWYGSGGGLDGIELFQDGRWLFSVGFISRILIARFPDIYTFAINDFNEPSCANINSPSTATVTGPWAVTTPHQSDSQYLTAILNDVTSDNNTSVVFQPDIKQSGNYSVTIFTPGCIQDGTCLVRGKVNITGSMASATRPATIMQTEIFQTNNFDKYDPIYYGYVEASSGSFRPSVTIAASAGQSGPMTVVAQKIRFELVNSTGGLNGLYEFDPSQKVVDTDFSRSVIDQAGTDLDANAIVTDVALSEKSTFIAGNFSSANISNIFSIQDGKTTELPGGGLDGPVYSLLMNGTLLYVGGNFSNTKEGSTAGLSNVAAYSTPDQKWLPLGAGVNGRVLSVVLLTLNITANKPEIVISLAGDFDQVLAFKGNGVSQVQGLALWVPSKNNWLQNLDVQTPSIAGVLTAGVKVPGGNYLLAGSLASGGLGASGAVTLSTSGPLGLGQLPLKIQPKSTRNSPSRKRALAAQQNVTGVVAGYFYEAGNRNLTILGGHFTARGSDGSNVDNLVFINGSNSDAVTGMGDGLSSDSAFLALAVQNDVLYAGGTVTGKVREANINGLVVYDLVGAKYGTQVPALAGHNVSVNAIAPRPNSGDIYVAGNFESAGSLDCPSVCIFSTSTSQWNRPGSGISGSISAITWAGNSKLVVGGNLTVNNSISSMAAYDAKANKWTSFKGANEIPGPVTALAIGNDQGSQFWVAGERDNGLAFMMKYDGSTWLSLGDSLGKSTRIRGLQVLSLSKPHAKSNSLDQNQIILITGELNLPNFGNASAALFNGTTFTPFLLSTTANGQGSLSRLFSQKQNFFSPNRGHLALGFIILISLAIALVLVFLIVVVGVYVNHLRLKKEGYFLAPTDNLERYGAMQQKIRPQDLFESIGRGGRGPRGPGDSLMI